MAEFRIKRADIVALQPCKSIAINLEANDPKLPTYQLTPLEVFDVRVKEQGLDPHDLVFPDGWTELHSVFLYQRQPLMHQWLTKHGLIPANNVAAQFPAPILYGQYGNFPKASP